MMVKVKTGRKEKGRKNCRKKRREGEKEEKVEIGERGMHWKKRKQ